LEKVEKEKQGQPVNTGLPGKWPSKWCMCDVLLASTEIIPGLL